MYDCDTEILTKEGWLKLNLLNFDATLMGVAGNEMLCLKPLEINSKESNRTINILKDSLNIYINHDFFYSSNSSDIENINFDMFEADKCPLYIPQKFFLVEDDIPALPEIQKIRCFLGICSLFLVYANDFDREFIILDWDKKERYIEDLSFYAMFLNAEIIIDEEEKIIKLRHDPFVLSGLPLVKFNNEDKIKIYKTVPNWFLNTPILAQLEFLKIYIKHQKNVELDNCVLDNIQTMAIQCGMSINYNFDLGEFVETEGLIKIESKDIIECDKNMTLYSIVTTPSNLLIFRKNGIVFIGHGGIV